MIWLILQMLTFLVLAAGLGGLLGWWLRGLRVDEDRRREAAAWEHRLEEYKRRLAAYEADDHAAADRLAACEAREEELARRLAECLAERDAQSAEEAPAPGAAIEPAVESERWVVTGRDPSESEES